MGPFVDGFLLQASLILALGAQNLFVLESGLKRQGHLLVAFVSSLCDTVLILIGVAGAASIFLHFPILKICFGVSGVAFLFYYGFKKLSDGLKVGKRDSPGAMLAPKLRQTVLLTLGFSLLNPHVYLDTLILVGGYSAKYVELQQRLQFGAGAASVSIFWFFGLSSFAFFMSRLLKNQRSMKIVSVCSGVILLVLSLKLGRDIYGWIVHS